MPSSEDYLDDLLNSINKAKSDNDRGMVRGRDNRSRRRRSIDADDDFMEANGLSDYIPRRIGRENLRRALSEDDILRDFESELNSGTADSFLDDFERELELDEEMGDGAWDIDEIFSDSGSRGGRSRDDETDGEDIEAYDKSSGAQSDKGAASPAGLESLGEAAGGDIDLSVESVPGESIADGDNLMQNLENIINDAKQEGGGNASGISLNSQAEPARSGGDACGISLNSQAEPARSGEELDLSSEDLLGSEFGPDELDMSMLNPDGSAMEVPLMDESGEDVDLMAALSEGDGELMDIGDLLSADENAEELGEARDAFEASAENILGGEDLSDANFGDDGVEEAGEGKGGIFAKIISAIKNTFKKKPKDGEGEEEDIGALGEDGFVEIGEFNPSADELSAESEDILAGFTEEGENPEFAGSSEEPPEDKKKKKKEKKKKEKKEKKPKEPDNSPKIPLKAIIGFLLFAISIIILVKILQGLYADWLQVGSAKTAYDNGNYLSAYTSLNGVNIKEDDEENFLLLERSRLLAPMQMKYREYELAMEDGDYEKALDSVIIGSMYYRQNLNAAEELEVTGPYNELGAKLEQQMFDQFGMTEDQAIELFKTKKREDYTVELKHILKDLGMENKEKEE